jgi:hypothetical protein
VSPGSPGVAFLTGKRVLLIVSGGIAAYKALELIRLLTQAGSGVRCVLTEAAAQFVTPLSLQALSGEPVHTTLWSLTEESEMGHIVLSRSADLVVVCPASANILAQMAAGLRSGGDPTAGDRHEGAGRAGDERAHVAASGDAGEPRHAARARRRRGRAG